MNVPEEPEDNSYLLKSCFTVILLTVYSRLASGPDFWITDLLYSKHKKLIFMKSCNWSFYFKTKYLTTNHRSDMYFLYDALPS